MTFDGLASKYINECRQLLGSSKTETLSGQSDIIRALQELSGLCRGASWEIRRLQEAQEEKP